MSHIFVSYAIEDFTVARRIADAIRSVGLDTWLDDQKIRPGMRWRSETEDAIKSAAAVVFVVSSESLWKDGFVQKELEIALDEEQERRSEPPRPFLFPIVVERVRYDSHPLSEFHSIDVSQHTKASSGKLILELSDFLRALEAHEKQSETKGEEAPLQRPEGKIVSGEHLDEVIGTNGRLFSADELDIYCNKKTLESFVFYGKEIDLDIEFVEFIEGLNRVRVVYRDGKDFDLGVRVQWLVRPYLSRASELQFVRTHNKHPIDGVIVPLFIVREDGTRERGSEVRGREISAMKRRTNILSDIHTQSLGVLGRLFNRK